MWVWLSAVQILNTIHTAARWLKRSACHTPVPISLENVNKVTLSNAGTHTCKVSAMVKWFIIESAEEIILRFFRLSQVGRSSDMTLNWREREWRLWKEILLISHLPRCIRRLMIGQSGKSLTQSKLNTYKGRKHNFCRIWRILSASETHRTLRIRSPPASHNMKA